MKFSIAISLAAMTTLFNSSTVVAQTYGLCIDNIDKRCGSWRVDYCVDRFYIHGTWRTTDKWEICRLITNRLDDGVNAICQGRASYGCGTPSITSESYKAPPEPK